MRFASVSLLVALTTLGCPASGDGAAADAKATTDAKEASDPKPPEPAAPKVAPQAGPEPALADKRAKAKAKITGADAAQLAERRKQMLASLNEGRKLVKDGELESGIAKYRDLLAIAPNYGPALGELGWAEFKLGKLDEADDHTQRALGETTDPNKRGMLLYNLGRIAEARGENDDAIGHYRDSLAARPNGVVEARLAELSAAAPTPVAPPANAAVSTGLAMLGQDLADLDAMCELAGRETLCGLSECTLEGVPDGETDIGVLLVDDFMVGCWLPAVKTAKGWTLFDLAFLKQQGSEVDQDVDDLGSRIETNDAGKFLIIGLSDHVYERVWVEADFEDEDAAFPEGSSTEREATVVCRIDGVPACSSAITTRYDYSGGDEGGDDASYSATLSLRGDVIVIADVKTTGRVGLGLEGGGGWDGYLMLEAGEYPVADLAKAAR